MFWVWNFGFVCDLGFRIWNLSHPGGLMVNISEYLREENIKIGISAKDKKTAIQEILEIGSIDREEIVHGLIKREELESTGFGNGIAVPHARLDEISSITILIGISREGIQFDSLDGKPVHLIFIILAPKSETKLYIYILAKLIRILEEEKMLEKLIDTDTPRSFIEKYQNIEGIKG